MGIRYLKRCQISVIFRKMKFKTTLRYYLTHVISVQFSRLVVSDSLRPHESQHAKPPCPSPTPGVHSNSRPSIGDAIQPSHPLVSRFPTAPNPSQHQSLVQWVNSAFFRVQLSHPYMTTGKTIALTRWTADGDCTMKLKDTYSLEGKLWPT